jgi:hypothetical protein
LTDVGSYVLMLHVREARVSETALPATFPRLGSPGTRSYLLATDSAGGSPVVLVADAENMNIRAWEQCKTWKAWPHVVIEREAILGFNDEIGREEGTTRTRCLELLWFGERSGAVCSGWISTPRRSSGGIVGCHTHKCIVPTRWIFRLGRQPSAVLLPFD